MSNQELRDHIKSLIQAMGWSERQAADCIYEEMDHDYDDDDGRARFYESFRKKLNRNSTKRETLLEYERILKAHRAFNGQDKISPTYVDNDALSPESKRSMLDISRSVSDMVKRGV